jgi:hypothetical protein
MLSITMDSIVEVLFKIILQLTALDQSKRALLRYALLRR